MSASDEAARRQAQLEAERSRREAMHRGEQFLAQDREILAEVRKITDMSDISREQAAWLIGILAGSLSRRVGDPPPPLDGGGDDRRADELEAERTRPVPRPDRVVACDRQDLAELFGDMHDRHSWRGMNQHAYTAAERIAAAAGIEFP